MLVRRHTRALSAALGFLLSAGLALPASAAAASPDRMSVAPAVDLQRVMAVLDSRSGRVPNSVTGWHVDPASNSVVVSATDDAAAGAFASGQDKVRIEHVTTRPVLLADLHGGDAISTSEGGRCSVGFNAISGARRYVITAGHCTKLGGIWSGPDGSPLGPVAKSSFPDHDFGLVEVTAPSWEQTHDVDADGGGYLTVTGTIPAAVGDQVCLSGSTSGYHCGQVQALNETVNYGDGAIVHGLTKTNICAEAGDSGGSMMSGTQAQGTLSGGSGGCLLGGQSYFQPIREVLSTYGLTLITGGASTGGASRDER
ncbi:MAG: S1 family peptidase [Pseudonocardiaceae bacterium]